MLRTTSDRMLFACTSRYRVVLAMWRSARTSRWITVSLDAEAPPDGRHPYPINALRNLALDSARTELVFLLDVDFAISSRLRASLRREHQALVRSLSLARTALVVPAFEIREGAKMPTSQREMEARLAARRRGELALADRSLLQYR